MRTKKSETIIYFIPIFVLLCIHPLFLRLYEYDNGLGDYAWMGQSEGRMDLFLHGKMILFECICAACVICLICYLFRENQLLRLPKAFLLLAGYAVLAFASTMLSDYRQFGFSGNDEQFENIWCLIGYVLVIVYVYLMVQNRQHVRMLLYALLVGSLIIGFIGVFQFIGHDLLMTDFARQFYVPGSLRGTLLNVAFGVGTVYMTLYNPGYVGLYTSLVCPVLIVLAFYDEKIPVRVLSVISCIFLVIGTVGSRTVGGYIGLGVSFFVLLVMMLRKWCTVKRNVLLAILGCLALVIVAAGGFLLYRMLHTSAASDSYKLTSIEETDDYVEFCYNDIYFREKMYVADNAVYLDFTDRNGEPIACDYDESSMIYTLTAPGLEGITSYSVNILDTYIGFTTAMDGKDWTFTYTYKDEDLSYYTVNAMNRLDKDITSESAVFTGHYRLFNGRGYIWAKTIPLLKHYLLLGSGADSFALVFPQSDYVSAYQGGYENMLITKPHCIYLQAAVQTGVLSLLLLLAFYLWYAADCLKLYFLKQIPDDRTAFAVAIFSATTGFLVLSLINDSTICVTPVFCALLGIGLALNRINRESSTH